MSQKKKQEHHTPWGYFIFYTLYIYVIHIRCVSSSSCCTKKKWFEQDATFFFAFADLTDDDAAAGFIERCRREQTLSTLKIYYTHWLASSYIRQTCILYSITNKGKSCKFHTTPHRIKYTHTHTHAKSKSSLKVFFFRFEHPRSACERYDL